MISEALIFNIFRCKTTLLLIYFFAKEVLEGGWEGGYNIEILIKIALISLTYSLSNPMTKSFTYNYFALPTLNLSAILWSGLVNPIPFRSHTMRSQSKNRSSCFG